MKWFSGLDPWKIKHLTLSQLMSYTNAAISYEEQQYSINQPAMSDGKKYERTIEKSLNQIWDSCFPKLKSYEEKREEAMKKRAKKAKEEIAKLNEMI